MREISEDYQTMKLKEALWKNWSCWAQGGLDDNSIRQQLDEESVHELLSWANVGIPKIDQYPLKRSLDLGSWCLYGTHTLPYLDRQMREKRLEEISKLLGLETSAVKSCVARAHDLPAEV